MLSKPDWGYWQQVPAGELWECVALSLDFEPRELLTSLGDDGWEDETKERRAEYEQRLDILIRHVSQGVIEATTVSVTRNDAVDRMVGLEVFVSWAQKIRWDMPREIACLSQFATGAQGRHWPWGQHETKLLRDLAAAAQKWWANYDPTDNTTAPRSKEVVEWLMKERGAPQRVAEIMAQMLKSDDLRSGPRT